MMAWLEHNKFLVLLVAALLFVLPLAAQAIAGGPAPGITFQTELPLPDGAPIRVHISGAVARPGVYDLRSGDRVTDGVSAAGGFQANADTDALNLARRLRDGEQVVVPLRRVASAPAAAPLGPGETLDINQATEAQLDLLPGIGEAYSRRIVDSRRVDGPFKALEDLLTRNVLPRALFDRVRDFLRIGP
jgi:competence protein ComEA